MTNNKDISQIILDKIKKSGIKPTSKIFFILKRYLFWFLVGISVVIGSISFALVISLLLNNDWHLYNYFGFGFILQTLPYFWIISFILFIFFGEFYYKKTFLGYRRRVIVIVGVYLIITVILGIILYSFGLDNRFEQVIYKKVRIYQIVNLNREKVWLQPQKGLLSGKIILIDKNRIEIVDKKKSLWEIKTEHSFIGGRVNIRDGECIKIIGQAEDDQVFIAQEIRPCFSNIGKIRMINKNRNPDRFLNNRMR